MTKEELDNARIAYNKMGFISENLIEIIDELKGTTQYKHQLKKHLNDALKQIEKITDRQYQAYQEGGFLPQPNGKKVHSLDVYNVTSDAYNFLLNKLPSEIACIAKVIRDLEAKDEIKYKEIDIYYKPIIK